MAENEGEVVVKSERITIEWPEDVVENHIWSKRIYVPPQFFEFKGPHLEKENMSLYKCLMGCKTQFKNDGEEKYLSVGNNSLFNLRRHIKSFHMACLPEFNAQFAMGANGQKTKKRDKLHMPSLEHFQNSYFEHRPIPQQIVNQEDLDHHILNFLIKDVQSLRVVDKPGFRELLGAMIGPQLVIKDRWFFTDLLAHEYLQRKTVLAMALAGTSCVATTADCWTVHGRTFLGMTAHWLGEDLARRSACLAVRRIKNKLSYEVIAKAIESVHVEFNLTSKVNCTTADNGAHFQSSSAQTRDGEGEEEDGESGDEDDISYVAVGDILNPESSQDGGGSKDCEEELEEEHILLPPVRRCACHSLNLIATADMKYIQSHSYKKMKRGIDAKLQAVWNQQKRSSEAAELIREKLTGTVLVVPNQADWNSFYEALCRVKYLLVQKNDQFKQLLDHFKVSHLKSFEEDFIKEYLKIMRPLSEAVNVLRNEENMSVGCVLPTVTLLKEKMESLDRDVSLIHCKPLVTAISEGIKRRFDAMFQDQSLRLASLCDPNFKTIWVPEEGQASDKRLLKEEVLRQQQTTQQSSSMGYRDDESDNDACQSDGGPCMKKRKSFLDGFKKRHPKLDQVDKYFNEGPGNVDQLLRYPTIKKIFIERNSALPSSAACQRLFGTDGPIFQTKGSKLVDSHYEMLIFMKLNGPLVYRLWDIGPNLMI